MADSARRDQGAPSPLRTAERLANVAREARYASSRAAAGAGSGSAWCLLPCG